MNVWKNFGAHAIAALALILPYVVQYAPGVPGWGPVAASVAGGLLLVVHALQQPTAPTVPPAATKILAMFAVAGMLVACTLTGCASFNAAINQSSTEQTLIQDGVKAGVLVAILTQPASGQKSTAQGIIQAAQAVEGIAVDEQLTISQLNVVIAQRLTKTSLNPAVQAILSDAIGAVVDNLAQKVSSKVLAVDATTTVNTLMGWVIAGATPFAGS